MDNLVLRWRRIDSPGIELLRLRIEGGAPHARSTLIDAGADPFAAEYEWQLDESWRTRSLIVRVYRDDMTTLSVVRTGDTSWSVEGHARRDLDGCAEIDLSATPFCNTLALRHLGPAPGAASELTALYVRLPELTCAPSRQRYERVSDRIFKYVDLGLSKGFEAEILVDDLGLIKRYEGLFERIDGPC
jgi:uncharacterized protein